MAGKLLYSRVLQNRMIKNQSVQEAPTLQKQPFYTSQHENITAEYPVYDKRPANNNRGGERSEPNKTRRGPGRRIASEKRTRSMDVTLMNKYSSLPEGLQEKVNATIEICYQQYKSGTYKNALRDDDQSHYDEDVVIDNEIDLI